MKIKIIVASSGGCYNCDEDEIFFPATGDWEEIPVKEFGRYTDAVNYANANMRSKHSSEKYILISYSDTTKAAVFENAKTFLAAKEKEKAREEKRKADAKVKREANARARKMKQLENLKKELGE